MSGAGHKLLSLGRFLEAGREFERVGAWQDALDAYEQAGLPAEVARVHLEQDRPLDAAQVWLSTLPPGLSAAHVLVGEQRTSAMQASAALELAGDPAAAAGLALLAGNRKKAAIVLMRAGREDAGRDALSRGDFTGNPYGDGVAAPAPEASPASLQRLQDAERALAAGDARTALDHALGVPRDDGAYPQACGVVARCVRQLDELDFEVDHFLGPMLRQPDGPRPEHRAVLAELARMYDAQDFDEKALMAWEGVLSLDPSDDEALEARKAITQALSSQSLEMVVEEILEEDYAFQTADVRQVSAAHRAASTGLPTAEPLPGPQAEVNQRATRELPKMPSVAQATGSMLFPKTGVVRRGHGDDHTPTRAFLGPNAPSRGDDHTPTRAFPGPNAPAGGFPAVPPAGTPPGGHPAYGSYPPAPPPGWPQPPGWPNSSPGNPWASGPPGTPAPGAWPPGTGWPPQPGAWPPGTGWPPHAQSQAQTSGFGTGPTALLRAVRGGEVIADRYEVSRLLGKGGMGSVFAVFDRHLEEEVALKLFADDLNSADDSGLKRFKREMKICRRLNHPNIVRVFEFGEWEGAWFITMELMQGQDLHELISKAEEPLDPELTVDLMLQALAGLAAAHEEGVVHRDVKPHNMFVVDGGTRLKLMDFGIAKSQDVSQKISKTGMLVGTPAYIAPERLRDTDDPLELGDLYAIGACMYEMLALQTPFSASDVSALLLRIVQGDCESLDVRRPDLPKRLAACVHKLLSLDPKQRPQSAEAAITELQKVKRRLRSKLPF